MKKNKINAQKKKKILKIFLIKNISFFLPLLEQKPLYKIEFFLLYHKI